MVDIHAEPGTARTLADQGTVTLFLCGDVMTGRGIDQVLPHPGDPQIYESYMKSARGYVEIAERDHGPIPRPVSFDYIWGDALAELERVSPHARVINLETSITAHDEPWPDKGINYRMHPDNVPCLSALKVDCCALANNHVMDWGRAGLTDTVKFLQEAGVATAGAGENLAHAQAPAIVPLSEHGRLLVFSVGTASSGIPADWAAADQRAGVYFLTDPSRREADELAEQIRRVKQPGDIALASIHWGGNWGYGIPQEQRDFAHDLIDYAGIDIVHGHSSHHPRGIEIYNDRAILYGCGDFINDYEGFSGKEHFRPDLVLMYFPTLSADSGKLLGLELTALQIRRFRLQYANEKDTQWLAGVLDREGARMGSGASVTEDRRIRLHR